MNKQFYEKVILAKLISVETGVSLNDAFKYVQTKGDDETTDYVWLNIAGDHVDWDDHLLYVATSIVGLRISQPGYEPFTVTEETLESDPKYKDWYETVWAPYLTTLLSKYSYVFERRFNIRTERGAKDVVSLLKTKYNYESTKEEPKESELSTDNHVEVMANYIVKDIPPSQLETYGKSIQEQAYNFAKKFS